MSTKAKGEEQEVLFLEDKGIWSRFLRMLMKANLPFVWIAVYIVLNVVLINVGISATEYTSLMFSGNVSFQGVILPFLIYTAASLLIAAVHTIVDYAVIARIDRNLRRMVWDKISRLPMSYFNQNKPKELLTRITNDTTTISSMIIKVLLSAIMSLYSLYAIFAKVASYDHGLMWSLLIVVPFVLVTGVLVGKMKFGINDSLNRKFAEVARNTSEKITNETLIKATGSEEREAQAGAAVFEDYYRTTIKSNWINQLSSPVYTVVSVLQLTLIVLVGRAYYQRGDITLANWIAYLAFAQQAANTLQAYAGYWASLKTSQGATRRVTFIMDEPEEQEGPQRTAEDMAGDFVFHDVSFGYGDTTVIDHLNLTIPEGKVTALIGMSGGGKTTLMNLLERFYDPSEGTITIGGEDIASYNMKSYRDRITYITQESTMLSGTIRDNILYGVHRDISEEELAQACRASNADEFIREFPDGLDTEVGEGGALLSGGQKQRIAITRAMLKNSRFLFLDEATAAMDAKAKQEVWAGIEGMMLTNNLTTVMVAHDYQTASHADFVVVLDHGRIQDSGSQEELLQRNAFFREFVNGEA